LRLLQYKGYKQGDVFAIYAPNIIEYVYIFQAVLLIGGVITTANQLYTASELEHQLQHSKAICLFTSADLLEKGTRDIFLRFNQNIMCHQITMTCITL
jgi:acyl-CoA synthetase (AMP-forming)/AMP-acid ligase II